MEETERQNPEGGTPKEEPKRDDYAELKAALEKERTLRKEAVKRSSELESELGQIKGEFETIHDGIKKATDELKGFRFRDEKTEFLKKTIGELGDGFTVDFDKAGKLAEKITDSETWKNDIADIIEVLKIEKPSETEVKKDRVLKGQPKEEPGPIDTSKLGTLFRENPEGFKQFIEERRKNNPFFSK